MSPPVAAGSVTVPIARSLYQVRSATVWSPNDGWWSWVTAMSKAAVAASLSLSVAV